VPVSFDLGCRLGPENSLYYSESELSERVGKKVAIKGFLADWTIGGEHTDNECAILSSDQLTYVRIGLPCEFSKSRVTGSEQRAASQRRASWMNELRINCVVIARGVLRRSEANLKKGNASRTYLLLDQRTLKITKSSWCS
jgi:hypothetical protein